MRGCKIAETRVLKNVNADLGVIYQLPPIRGNVSNVPSHTVVGPRGRLDHS